MYKLFWINQIIVYSIFFGFLPIVFNSEIYNRNYEQRCTVTNNGKELNCQGIGLQSVEEAFESHISSSTISNITKINFNHNSITYIPATVLNSMTSIEIIFLRRNQIKGINHDGFKNLPNLKVLELDDNCLTEIPKVIKHLHNLEDLSLSNNKIKQLDSNAFSGNPNITSIDLRGNPIKKIHFRTFQNHVKLRKLILSNNKELMHFPSLNGTQSLEILRLDRASLTSLSDHLCVQSPNLKSLNLESNFLTTIPHLKDCRNLRVLNLVNNKITEITGNKFTTLNLLHDLLLSRNGIKTIPSNAFNGLKNLQVLDLQSNEIEYIDPDAFSSCQNLKDLNLGNNMFPTLPITGLQNLRHLKTFNNPKLEEFPSTESFPSIKTMVLSYAYHCCAFLSMNKNELIERIPIRESIIFPTDNSLDASLWNSSLLNVWIQLQKLSRKNNSGINNYLNNLAVNFTEHNGTFSNDDNFLDTQNEMLATPTGETYSVKCLPRPGPFLPCRDLFDWWTLRCGVWIVFLLAMLGNGTVVFVIVFSRSKMDVPRFLVCNLAAADFFMGIYLGLLAVIDASTLGEFRKYAIPWQMSVGCQLAGFLGVLSSELSVYTLSVITLERNYAITHAIHLNKRLSLKNAGYIMIIGWIFSLSMAILPLLGVSDYRKFAICLPFEIDGTASLSYLVFLMLINGVAFLILMGCYLRMYCAIRGSQAWNSNDSRIAKRMALLVFTDFLCWSPIAFFSLTAMFGLRLVSLEQAKVFAVFILPFNSCCNPFLYAIMTKQFKKDCVLICKAIEESRVTRGIGRCRHSSNFSNRQTPFNTNSIVDRSSREHQTLCVCNSRHAIVNNSKRWCGLEIIWSCGKGKHQRRSRADQYAYRIAEIQQKQHKRACSMSSSENFSSSRSDSWRQANHCSIPLRFIDSKKHGSLWLIARKSSHDSNLSSSRNDSSSSGITASTSTWKISRSSTYSDIGTPKLARPKPRLIRQSAIQEPDSLFSPSRLAVRLLATIPSSADTNEQLAINNDEKFEDNQGEVKIDEKSVCIK
ncbi:lutropin-choriogonadotropic hormone receptor isoform X1 [Cotesia glomerata]|uniref:lutropin-choriogonadotropic hormone receptor isoform X1 n=2 Tax=Cotesia glomerata TaxID=32391 RepID=UPI001D02A383|nr:lutropin-choriogonadotropic hormone receptor isoform X1 [Cotesia glomerata]